MSNCLNCQKEIQNTPGKRSKTFCSDNCRASFHNKNKKKEPRYVQFEKYKRLFETNQLILADMVKLEEANLSLKKELEDIKSRQTEESVLNQRKTGSVVNIRNFNNQPKSDYSINTEMPVRMKGEDAIDFAIRKNLWKQHQKK